MTDRGQLLSAAREAVAGACAVCRRVQSEMERVKRIVKDDDSPVTIADFASQAVVGHILTRRLGAVVMVGEESSAFLREPAHAVHLAATLEAARVSWPEVTEASLLSAIDVGAGEPREAFWTLDPIDGTKGFLRGEQYAVALAYVESGEPVVGVLGCPNLAVDQRAPLDRADAAGTLYSAVYRGGVDETVADGSGPRGRIRRGGRSANEPVRVCASVEKAHSNISDTDRIMTIVDPGHTLVQLDSQCKYAVVARGQADVYLRMPTKKGYVERIWDHAAGALVATEAGCIVTDIAGRPLDFSHGRGLEANRGILCATPHVHSAVLRAIGQLGLA